MEKLTFFSRYVPKIGDIAFDADFSASVNISSILAKYPLESGFTITNAVIENPTRITLSVGMGEQAFKSGLLGKAEAYTTGLLSNFIDSGLGNFALGAVANGIFKGESRGGAVLASLQALKLSAEPFDIVLHDLGVMRQMLIESIDVEQKAETGNGVFFDVVLEQVQSNITPRVIEKAQKEKDMGEVTVEEVSS